MRLLLLSNSTNHGFGYLDHAAEEIGGFFAGVSRAAFVPFALFDHAAHGARAAERFRRFGLELTVLREDGAAAGILDDSEAIFVGGGNTFRLVDRLYRNDLLEPIRRLVRAGLPYLGSSAGTVISGPTIGTTNDMPIVHPTSLVSLGFVPFQLNCHYIDADPGSRHMGETRETRLREYHEENDTTIAGLREGAWLRVEESRILLGGTAGARIFVKGRPPSDQPPGADLSGMLAR